MVWKILRYGGATKGAREREQRPKGGTAELLEHLNLPEVGQFAFVDGQVNSPFVMRPDGTTICRDAQVDAAGSTAG
jgi:hypothetical protein